MDSQFRGFIPVIAPRILIFLYSSFLQFLFSFYTHRSEFFVFLFFFLSQVYSPSGQSPC